MPVLQTSNADQHHPHWNVTSGGFYFPPFKETAKCT